VADEKQERPDAVKSEKGVSPMLSKMRKKTETTQAKKFLSARKK